MIKVLLTGANGFIGSHVAEELLRQGYSLAALRRLGSDIKHCGSFSEQVKWINWDQEGWQDKVRDFSPEVIIHIAWSGVDAGSRNNWSRQLENLLLQQQLLDIALALGIKRFIALGSQAEYGTLNACVDESFPAKPNTAYGAAKLATLEVLRSFCDLNGIRWYWFRLFSCFGEREAENWLIPATIRKMRNGENLDFTGGEQRYAYLYVGEVAKTIVAAVTTAVEPGVYNLSSPQTITIRELLEKIKTCVHTESRMNFGALPYRPSQSMWMQGDMAKTNRIYQVDTSHFDAQLKQTVEYYLKDLNRS